MTHYLSSIFDVDPPKVGDVVELIEEFDAIIPPGTYTVSHVNEDGSFHVGGRTAVWPRRIKREAQDNE